MSSSTKPPSGTRDFLPAEIRRREHVIGVVRSVYERYGFEPLETPAFENIETLLGKYGEEGNKLIFKILRRGEHEASGEADLALRYDSTVPLARVVAQYQNELPKFFKRYQIQPVWRAERPAKGRFREFYQCDIDAVGSASLVVETELLAAVSEALGRLGFADFVVRLNHRRALSALLDCAGVPERLQGEALVALDKLDKIGVGGVEKELQERGVDADATTTCLEFFTGVADAGGSAAGSLDRVRRFVAGHPTGPDAVGELEEILRLSESTPARGRIRVDPSLARGLSYYTGAIMEVAVPDLAGSLAGGGRYNNLIGTFLGRDVPACGFSLGLERIVVVMTERGMFGPSVVAGAVDVVITCMDDPARSDALKLAGELREARLRAEVYPEIVRKFDKALKDASSRGARIMVVLGENERAQGQVSIRDLSARQQLPPVPRPAAASHIASLLGT